MAAPRELLDLRASHGDVRELGRDKEAVRSYERDNGQQADDDRDIRHGRLLRSSMVRPVLLGAAVPLVEHRPVGAAPHESRQQCPGLTRQAGRVDVDWCHVAERGSGGRIEIVEIEVRVAVVNVMVGLSVAKQVQLFQKLTRCLLEHAERPGIGALALAQDRRGRTFPSHEHASPAVERQHGHPRPAPSRLRFAHGFASPLGPSLPPVSPWRYHTAMPRRPVASVLTLGCKLNLADSEAIAARLGAAGYDVVYAICEADAVVVNTCSVTHAADRKSRRLIRAARRLSPTA
ncbi:MAG: hypothetical protein F4X03_03510, partial [Dehalococcoidia bacterium]|nr:hypothetical protein [Dehalococcoidia bacterium]